MSKKNKHNLPGQFTSEVHHTKEVAKVSNDKEIADEAYARGFTSGIEKSAFAQKKGFRLGLPMGIVIGGSVVLIADFIIRAIMK